MNLVNQINLFLKFKLNNLKMETEMDKIREELLSFYLNIKVRTQDEVSTNSSC